MPQLTNSEIARLVGGELQGNADVIITGLAPLAAALPEDATYLGDAKYRAGLQETSAGCVLLDRSETCTRLGLNVIRCENPSAAFTKLVQHFAPVAPKPVPGTHPSAVVDATAHIHESAAVGPLSVVGQGAQIHAGASLGHHVSVGAGCVVGENTVLHPGVVLYPGVRVGADCVIHGNSVIGADGFGFDPTAKGWEKIPQGGSVCIEDRVDIGAGCTIDCARFGQTRIGAGTKIDDQVHVAHNVQIGEHSLLIAQSGVAGSTHLGNWVILAGQAGIGGHLRLGDGVRVGAGSKVLGDVEAGTDVFGYPAGPKQETMRAFAMLPRLREKLRALQKRVSELEERS